LKNQVRITWGDPTIDFDEELRVKLTSTKIDPATVNLDILSFHHCVCVGIIVKRIEGSLDNVSLKTLVFKKHEFAWENETSSSIDHDGPTMLQILIQEINPTS